MKTIVVGISGSIAAYKACDVVRALIKKGYDVEVIMTDFVESPPTLITPPL